MDKEIILSEINLKAIRSSGAGGQNVNKVATKVVLIFNLLNSQAFTEDEIQLISSKIKSKLTTEGMLILNCDEARSQLKNKELVIKRLLDLLKKSLQVPKERKETTVPKAVIEKRLKQKASQSEIKQNRKKPKL